MAEKPAAEKTEQPTPRRIAKARQKGQVPQSQELPSVVILMVLLITVALLAPELMQWFTTQMRQGILCETSIFTDSKNFIDFVNEKIISLIFIICPILTALFIGSVLANIVVSGPNFAPAAITPRFNLINPATGLQKLVNTRSMIHLCISIAKLFFISIIVWVYLRSKIDMIATLRWAWSMQILAVIARIIFGLVVRICIALLVIAIIDVIYQKWKYIQDLKMTRQEVKEERKQMEGAPEVKSRIRRVQFELARKRMLQEVPKASVVLVNPEHVAVALRYEAKTMESPVVVAKGADYLAEKIREIARAYGVPVVRKPELARTIYSTVQLGDAIPQNLYVAVAEVLAMIYRLRHGRK
jgi:flagellar biosynthetic protein FlhB